MMDIDIVITDIDKLIKRKRDFYPNAKPGLKSVLNIDVKVLETCREFILQERQEANVMIKELQTEAKLLDKTADILYEICRRHGISDEDIAYLLRRGREVLKQENDEFQKANRITIPTKLRPYIKKDPEPKADLFIRDEFGNILINKTLENMRKLRKQKKIYI